MLATPTVSIVIVNWNTRELLLACLAALARDPALPSEILVVDNASHDGSCESVRASFPQVRVIALEANIGFPRANNVALEVAQGRYLLLLNPDTEVRSGAVAALVSFLEGTPRAGIAGPPLWNPDGSRQPSVLTFPSLASEFLRQTMLHRLLPGAEFREARRRGTRRVDAVTGAVLCIRRECFDAIGPLDPRFFMFYEDTDWCRRAQLAGWETWYVDGPGVLHHKGAASGGAERAATLVQSLRSTVLYFDKHAGSGDILWLRAIALASAAVRSLRSAVLWLIGADRHDQASRLAAYARIAGWALRGGELHP